MADICQKSNVEAILQLTFSSATNPTDTQVADWITEESQFVEEYTGRVYQETTATDTINGDGSNIIMLKHYPITSVTSLVVDDETLTESTDFWIKDYDAGVIKLLTATLPELDGYTQGNDSVVCTYKYGTTTIPAAVREFTALRVALRAAAAAGLAKTDGGALKSFSDGDLTLNFADSDKATAALMARYNELKSIVPRKLGAVTGAL